MKHEACDMRCDKNEFGLHHLVIFNADEPHSRQKARMNEGVLFLREEVNLLYDDVLLPHWTEFCDALQLNDSSDGTFKICNVQLPKVVLNMLSPALAMDKYTSFELKKNMFANIHEGTQFIIEFMRNNPSLKSFRFEDNPIGQ